MQLIIANWKANKSQTATINWFKDFRQSLAELATRVTPPATSRQVVIAPAAFLMPLVASEIAATSELVREKLGASITLGVQDISHFGAGSYTGGIAAVHLAELGVTHAIVGHSERRRYFHETHQEVAGKVIQALDNNITPVVCVDHDYTQDQIKLFDTQWLKKVVFAYEPLAAIGTGKNASISDVKAEVEFIQSVAGQVPVIYGGSVTEQSIGEYLLVTTGGLVGSASLDGKAFAQLLAAAW